MESSISPKPPTGIDYTKDLPKEILNIVFSYLDDPIDLGRCLRVNKLWNEAAMNEKLWEALYPKEAFGKKKWAYFGDIGKEPPLSRKFYSIYYGPCPIHPKKKVKDTHFFGIVPKTVDGEELTLNKWKVLIKSPKSGNPSDFRDIDSTVARKYGDNLPPETHWVLCLQELVPGTREKSYVHYKVPYMLDVIACLFMKYAISKVRLLNDMHTRCEENFEGFQIFVGGFTPKGLLVGCDKYANYTYGVLPLLKF